MAKGWKPRGNKGRAAVQWKQFEPFADRVAGEFNRRPTFRDLEGYLQLRERIKKRAAIVKTWGPLGRWYLKLRDKLAARKSDQAPDADPVDERLAEIAGEAEDDG